jgi:hypothetical protein
MKKVLASFAASLIVFICIPSIVFAANVLDPACQGNPDATLCQDNAAKQDLNANSIYGPNGILAKAATILAIIVGIACVIAIIIGGMRYILSGGDSQQTASAKNAILYAIIGLIITITARSILLFVLGRIK